VVCEKCDKPLDAMSEIKNSEKEDMSTVVREGSRALHKNEIKKIFMANLCITCHEKGENRIYGKKIDYNTVLSDAVHKPLLR